MEVAEDSPHPVPVGSAGDPAAGRRLEQTQAKCLVQAADGGVPVVLCRVHRRTGKAFEVSRNTFRAHFCRLAVCIEPVTGGAVAVITTGPVAKDVKPHRARGDVAIKFGVRARQLADPFAHCLADGRIELEQSALQQMSVNAVHELGAHCGSATR